MSNTTSRRYRATFLANVTDATAEDAFDVAYLAATNIDTETAHRGAVVGDDYVQVTLAFSADSDEVAVAQAREAMRHLRWSADSLRVTTGRGRNRRVVR